MALCAPLVENDLAPAVAEIELGNVLDLNAPNDVVIKGANQLIRADAPNTAVITT